MSRGILSELLIFWVRVNLVVKENGFAVDLVGTDYRGETQGSGQGHPLDRFPRGLITSEKGEVG